MKLYQATIIGAGIIAAIVIAYYPNWWKINDLDPPDALEEKVIAGSADDQARAAWDLYRHNEKARAAVERSESEALLAERRLERRRQLVEEGVGSRDDLDDGENQAKVARATLRSARADLARAELDLERTRVRAPYDVSISCGG